MTKPGDKHYTATVYIVTEEQPRKALLLHHRKHDKWVPPGGHQEANENPLEAAIREVKEETGLDIAKYFEPTRVVNGQSLYLPLPRYIMEQHIMAHGDEPEHFHLDMEYLVRVPHQAVNHQQDEAHGIGWFTVDELSNLHTWDDVRTVLQQELQQ